MFTNNISKIFVVVLTLAVAIVTTSFATHSNRMALADHSYDRVEQLRSLRPNAFTYDGIEQVRIDRTFNIPLDRSYDSVEQVRLGRISNADHFYDQIESLRLHR